MLIKKEQIAGAIHPENGRIASWLEKITKPKSNRTEFKDPDDEGHKIVVVRDQEGRTTWLFRGISANLLRAPRFVIWEENAGQLTEVDLPFGRIPSRGHTLDGSQYKEYVAEEKYYISSSGVAFRRATILQGPLTAGGVNDMAMVHDVRPVDSFRSLGQRDYQTIARFSAKIREWNKH